VVRQPIPAHSSEVMMMTAAWPRARVAALSSVLPYTLEVVALRRMPTSVFAVLMSLGPAIAAAAGWLVLHQGLDAAERLAIALVIAASVDAVVLAPARSRRAWSPAGA
jgi:inner membrane transporter RhtA